MSTFSTSNPNNVQARSLWIGDIEYWMDEGFIINIFQEVANVKNLKIIRDKLKQTNLGYGFIEFDTSEIAKEVLDTLNGRQIKDTNSAGKQAAMSNAPVTDYSIYVGELEASVNEDKLKEFFSKYYTSILGTKIIVDPVNKTSKGYGFVKFSDFNEAQRAVSEMNGKYLNGKSIKTNQASFKRMNSDSNLLSTSTSSNMNQFTPYNYNSYTTTNSLNNYSTDPNTFSSPKTNPKLFSYNQNMSYGNHNNSTGNSGKYQNYYNPSSIQQQQNTINTNLNSNFSQDSNLPNKGANLGSTYNNHTQQSTLAPQTLTNLNNFYIQNQNSDPTSSDSQSGNSFSLPNFYYNNFHNNPYYNQIYGNYYNYYNSSNNSTSTGFSNSIAPGNNYSYQNNTVTSSGYFYPDQNSTSTFSTTTAESEIQYNKN